MRTQIVVVVAFAALIVAALALARAFVPTVGETDNESVSAEEIHALQAEIRRLSTRLSTLSARLEEWTLQTEFPRIPTADAKPDGRKVARQPAAAEEAPSASHGAAEKAPSVSRGPTEEEIRRVAAAVVEEMRERRRREEIAAKRKRIEESESKEVGWRLEALRKIARKLGWSPQMLEGAAQVVKHYVKILTETRLRAHDLMSREDLRDEEKERLIRELKEGAVDSLKQDRETLLQLFDEETIKMLKDRLKM